LAGASGDDLAMHVEIPEDAEVRLVKAEETFKELGAEMQAFASTARAAARILRALGTDLKSAGVALIGLSNTRHLWAAEARCAETRSSRAGC